MYKRLQNFTDLGKESAFLWGPRQSGKTTLLQNLFPDAIRYDLLLSDEFARLAVNPALLREDLLIDKKGQKNIIIIDKVQKVPTLLDEIQWLIVNHGFQFILCGSSVQKLYA